MSAPTRTLLRREERQESILRGAATAFARSGFAATSMDDVAAACGITRLIVYRHFDVQGRAVPGDPRAGLRPRMGEELAARLAHPTGAASACRTILTVAREDPDAFVLLWRHAAREPQFARVRATSSASSPWRRCASCWT